MDVDISDVDDVDEQWKKQRHQSNNKTQESRAKTDFDFNSTDWKEFFFHEITHHMVDGTISWDYTNFFTEKSLCFVKWL